MDTNQTTRRHYDLDFLSEALNRPLTTSPHASSNINHDHSSTHSRRSHRDRTDDYRNHRDDRTRNDRRYERRTHLSSPPPPSDIHARIQYRNNQPTPKTLWPRSPEIHHEDDSDTDPFRKNKTKSTSANKKKEDKKKNPTFQPVHHQPHTQHEVSQSYMTTSAPEPNVVSEIGPPLVQPDTAGTSKLSYGKALLAGEGSAMAAFIQDGKRIPRRGEIGLTGAQIEKYEDAGFVMSGNRHQRMNAVRLRKENQVISAEERRKILLLKAEERTKKESVIMSDFKELVDRKVKRVHLN